jgi:hypothetical protein
VDGIPFPCLYSNSRACRVSFRLVTNAVGRWSWVSFLLNRLLLTRLRRAEGRQHVARQARAGTAVTAAGNGLLANANPRFDLGDGATQHERLCPGPGGAGRRGSRPLPNKFFHGSPHQPPPLIVVDYNAARRGHHFLLEHARVNGVVLGSESINELQGDLILR